MESDEEPTASQFVSQKLKASGKWINDPIHGHFRLDDNQLQFIDTPQFQRLRNLKQLGTTYFVFPGASHNRFEHCLGVSHLASTFITRICREQPELGVSEREQELVKLSGMLHDLGHGPFSHVFDGEFMPRVKPDWNWKHEQGSVDLLDYLIDENNIDIDNDDVRKVKSLILGEPTRDFKEKLYLFDIVANYRNGVDVDKFDYLSRDCHNLGIKSSYDSSRLINFSRVINNEVCFHAKEAFNLYEMFHTRYSLHKQVYSHRVGKCIELMITDAFVLADKHLDISGAVKDMERYTLLNDDILSVIESSRVPELEASRKIIHNLRTRRLYKFADEIIVPNEMYDRLKPLATEQEIVTHQEFGSNLRPDDIIVKWTKIDYGFNNSNPVDKVRFFSRWDDTESFNVPKNKVSTLIPDKFLERYLRVFCRNAEHVPAAQKAFRRFINREVRSLSPTRSLSPNPAFSVPLVYPSPLKPDLDGKRRRHE